MTGVEKADPFVRCDQLETATGWIYGLEPAASLPRPSTGPYEALEQALLPALQQPPCFVTFSGGRDSSAVLASAATLARKEGFPLPVPVTRTYPDEPATDESEWQRSVVEHLQLSEWIQFAYHQGETDLLGDAARKGLRTDGLLWPPAMHTHRALYAALGPGSVVTGEGGDAVLGDRRGTPLARLRRGPGRRAAAKSAVASLLPGSVHRARVSRAARNTTHSRWLQPAALAEHAHRIADDVIAEPLRFDEGTWYLTRLRAFRALTHNHSIVAAEHGLRAFEPLLNENFVASLARAGGRWGLGDRTQIMKFLFSDLLPTAVLERTTKASFNSVYTGQTTRDFAQRWDGSGVDPSYVDPERLRAVWLSDRPTMSTGVLLHSAWLAAGEDA